MRIIGKILREGKRTKAQIIQNSKQSRNHFYNAKLLFKTDFW